MAMSFWESQGLPAEVSYGDIVAAVRSVSTCQGLFMTSVLRKLQQQCFGLKKRISSDDAAVLEKELGSSLGDILQTAASTASAKLPPLCSMLEELVTKTDLTDKERVKSALRDKHAPFEVVSKESTGRLVSFLRSCGVGSQDAEEIALAIYAKKRRTSKRALKGLSKLNNAKEALVHQDAIVDLSNCELDAGMLEKTVPLICNDKQLTCLLLRGNNIHLAGSKLIAQIIISSPRLVSIDVSGNNLLTEGIKTLFSAVKESKSLTHLAAANCHGGPATITLAKEFLSGHPTIHSLNLCGNDIMAFTDFPVIPDLCEVSLSCNFLSRGSVDGFRKLLASHPLLRKLDASFNELDEEAWGSLRDTLTKHESLQTFLANGNKWLPPAVDILGDILSGNSRIVSTDVLQVQDRCKANQDKTSQRIASLRAASSSINWGVEDVDAILLHVTSQPSTLRTFRGMDGPTLRTKRFGPNEALIDADDWDALLQFPW